MEVALYKLSCSYCRNVALKHITYTVGYCQMCVLFPAFCLDISTLHARCDY